MKLKPLLLCAIASVLPLSANAASKQNNDRWFEIEVILFSQLGDKSLLKESFPETVKLPEYRHTTDLLAEYLNPNIASLKQLLAPCDPATSEFNYSVKPATLPPLFSEMSLEQIANMAPTALSSQLNSNFSNTQRSFSDGTQPQDLAANSITSPSNNSDTFTFEYSAEKRAEIQALVLAADEEFNRLEFQYTATGTKISAQKMMCRIDESQFSEIKADDPNFNYNGFAVNKVPLHINAIEDINDNNTHLLSKESLKLGDVIRDLRYTKNFRPILHMGWRQVARPKRQSVPVNVYAGDNFAADYQRKLAEYVTEQENVQTNAQVNTQLNAPTNAQAHANNEALLTQVKRERIESIIKQISSVEEDTDSLLNSIKNEDLSLNADINLTPEHNSIKAPIPPVQDWFIDGFFNVHLKHYLFITADFSILDKNLAELATAQLASDTAVNNENSQQRSTALSPEKPQVQAKAIAFKQNRRVISGEVHYFDHPYMGMIVQIRPYKKPKPE